MSFHRLLVVGLIPVCCDGCGESLDVVDRWESGWGKSIVILIGGLDVRPMSDVPVCMCPLT